MPRTFTRSAHRIVPIKDAMLAGAAAARTRVVQQPANHPRRRADDIEHDAVLKPTPIKGSAKLVTKDDRLMNDWPEDNKPALAKATAVSMWDSKPCLLAAFWGWLPRP